MTNTCKRTYYKTMRETSCNGDRKGHYKTRFKYSSVAKPNTAKTTKTTKRKGKR